jgi:hypothetical protein
MHASTLLHEYLQLIHACRFSWSVDNDESTIRSGIEKAIASMHLPRLDTSQYASEIQTMAKKVGLSMAEFMNQCVFAPPLPPAATDPWDTSLALFDFSQGGQGLHDITIECRGGERVLAHRGVLEWGGIEVPEGTDWINMGAYSKVCRFMGKFN